MTKQSETGGPARRTDPFIRVLLTIVAAVVVWVSTSGLFHLVKHLRDVDVQSATVVTELKGLRGTVERIEEENREEGRLIATALDKIENTLASDKAELLDKISILERRIDGIDQWIIRNNDNHTNLQNEVRGIREELQNHRDRLLRLEGK